MSAPFRNFGGSRSASCNRQTLIWPKENFRTISTKSGASLS